MHEPVEFEDMPADNEGYTTNISVNFCGDKFVKKATCVVIMPDGSMKTLVKTIERPFP